LSDWKTKADEAARKVRLERQAAGLPANKLPDERAAERPKSLRAAINGKCYDCQGKNSDPHWKWRIGNCRVVDCTLIPVRPYQHLASKKNAFFEHTE
jgi:hypothetical protein